MGEYEYDGITSSDECVRLVFEDVLPRTHMSAADHDQMVEEINNDNNMWGPPISCRGLKVGSGVWSRSRYTRRPTIRACIPLF
jgi:hypothetical protein